MLVVILVIAALVPLITVIGARHLEMQFVRRGASGVARNPVIVVAVALALLGASLFGAVTALGQESDAAPELHDVSLRVVAQTPASTVSGRVTDGSGNPLRDVLLVTSPIGGWQSYTAETDVGGRYTLGAVDHGEYFLNVYASAADDRYADRYAESALPLSVTDVGPVRFDVRLQTVDEIENAMFQDAVVIDFGTRVESMLEPWGVQLFRFEVPAGGRSVVVETHGDLDLLARLVRVVPDAPDLEFAYDDDGGAVYNARIALELEPGWYTVEVQNYGYGPDYYEISVTLG